MEDSENHSINHKKMNKLILIGNGFDLALGLKTSYKDFLKWLILDELKRIIEPINNKPHLNKGSYINELFVISIDYPRYFDYNELSTIIDVFSLIDILKKNNISIIPKSEKGIIHQIINSKLDNWVDIEGLYFDILKKIINQGNLNYNISYITELNKEFEIIGIKLNEYLKTINTEIPYIKAMRFVKQFNDKISTDELITSTIKTIQTEIPYFLNFNYTDSLWKVLKYKLDKKTQINYIHGNLKQKESEIIFGYGDEMDIVYKKIEELNDNDFFRHIKSFQYFNNDNYRKLMAFLDSNEYQVCIYGHSCGLSDRIMLNEIFEHDKCKSIKIYFYENEKGENDFIDKTMMISRHFKSNQLMRKKIVEFNSTNKIPQILNR